MGNEDYESFVCEVDWRLFGIRVVMARKRLNMTAKKASQNLGIHRSWYHQLEHGKFDEKRKLGKEALERLFDLFPDLKKPLDKDNLSDLDSTVVGLFTKHFPEQMAEAQ